MSKYFIIMIFTISAAVGSDFTSSSADIFFGLYSNIIAPVKSHASQCQFIPSCSHYAAECISEHGAAVGGIMAADRWMRCAGGTANPNKYPKVGMFYYDPPNKNYLFAEGSLWSAGFNMNSGGIRLSKDEPVSFVHSLYLEDDYNSAILELKRMKYQTRDKDTSEYFDMMISLCNFKTGKTNQTLNSYDANYEFHNEQFKVNQFYYNYIMHDQLDVDMWNLNYLRKLDDSTIDSQIKSRLQLYSMLKLDMVEPNSSFSGISSDSIPLFCERLEDTPKSPALAGLLSTLLPGAGYFYCGEFKEGTSALVVNGLLAWGIYSLFDNNNTGSGILLSSVSAIFYFGNIIGSVNSAEIQNDRYKQLQLLQIRKSLNIEFVFETSFLEDMIKLIK